MASLSQERSECGAAGGSGSPFPHSAAADEEEFGGAYEDVAEEEAGAGVELEASVSAPLQHLFASVQQWPLYEEQHLSHSDVMLHMAERLAMDMKAFQERNQIELAQRREVLEIVGALKESFVWHAAGPLIKKGFSKAMINQNIQFTVFGSFGSELGFGNQASAYGLASADIDICIEVHPMLTLAEPYKLATKMIRVLAGSRGAWVKNAQFIRWARVPIIKFDVGAYSVDISCGNNAAVWCVKVQRG